MFNVISSRTPNTREFSYAMRKIPFMKTAVMLCVAVALFGCERSSKPNDNAQRYEVRGIVRGFSPDRSSIEIEHEAIPNFMPSMTMPFVARDQKESVDLKTGDAISFRMTVTQKDFWIDHVKKIRREDVDIAEPKHTPSASAERDARLKEGDEMPRFGLTDQNGERISLDTFRGQPFVLTFIFTRCPVPNFCPRMSSNFEELQTAIKAGSDTLAKTRLLSITLDPQFDTPQILNAYAASHQADAKVWTFATGQAREIDALTRAFSVYRQTEGGTISHGLATALINRDGDIDKIWRGNAWTPAEVIEAIQAEEK
jgi:protein SCO1